MSADDGRSLERHATAEVVIIVPHFPPFLGGMEQRIEEIAARLVRRGYTVAVESTDQGSVAGVVVRGGFRIRYHPSVEVARTPSVLILGGGPAQGARAPPFFTSISPWLSCPRSRPSPRPPGE